MKKTIVLITFSLLCSLFLAPAYAVNPAQKTHKPSEVSEVSRKDARKKARTEKHTKKLEKRLAKKAGRNGGGLIIAGLILLVLALAFGVIALVISLAGIIPLTATLLALAGVGLLVWGIVEILT